MTLTFELIQAPLKMVQTDTRTHTHTYTHTHTHTHTHTEFNTDRCVRWNSSTVYNTFIVLFSCNIPAYVRKDAKKEKNLVTLLPPFVEKQYRPIKFQNTQQSVSFWKVCLHSQTLLNNIERIFRCYLLQF